MELKDLYCLDVRLKLQAGMPIEVPEVGELRPKTLKEISKIGYSNYTKMLNVLTMNVTDTLKDGEKKANGVDINPFDVYCFIPDEKFVSLFLDAIKFFFNEEKILRTKLPISGGNTADIIILGAEQEQQLVNQKQVRMIHRLNFPYISEILKLQNGLKSHRVDGGLNLKKSRAQEIANRLAKSKEMVAKYKKNGNKQKVHEDIDVSDIISAVSTKSHAISKLNVWDLVLFQLYEEYRRLHAINQYEVNIQAIMNGAEGIELKDWSAKLDE